MRLYKLVTKNSYEEAIRDLNERDDIVCDTETDGLEWAKDNRVCGVSALSGDTAYYFPFRHGEGENLPESLLPDLCHRVLPPNRRQTGFNYKFDMHMLRREGLVLPERIHDSQLSAHLLNENEPSFKMESLAEKYVDPEAGKAEEKLLDELQSLFGGSRKTCKKNLWRLSPKKVAPYACQDVFTTRDLRDLHAPALTTWGLEDIYNEVCEYSLVLTEMEESGLQLNIPLVHQYIEEASGYANVCLEKAALSAGFPINLNSSKQCQAWLGVDSSAKDTLNNMLEDGDNRAQLLLDFRVWSKAAGTYYNPFLRLCDKNGVLHPNLNMTGTIIRLSCSNPNLQAIPVGTNVYKVKDVFSARPGYVFVEADFSQVEVRVMAHYTKDPMLIEIIRSGVNMHDKVSQEQNLPRTVAKRLNFSAQYGIGASAFAATYGYSLKESQEYLKKYHSMFPGMRRLYNAAEAKASKRGYVRLYTGRVQHFDGKKSPSRKASSRLVQGAVAEMIRIASTRIRKELPEARQLLQVHDSLNMEIPESRVAELVPEIKRIMCDQPWCDIPIKVDVKDGPSWGQAKEVTNG